MRNSTPATWVVRMSMSASCPPTGPVKCALGDIVKVRMPPTRRSVEPGFTPRVAFALTMIWSNWNVPAIGAFTIGVV